MKKVKRKAFASFAKQFNGRYHRYGRFRHKKSDSKCDKSRRKKEIPEKIRYENVFDECLNSKNMGYQKDDCLEPN